MGNRYTRTRGLTVWQLTGKGDVEEAALLPWLRLHSGPITGLSVRADARRLLTVGLDGKVFVVPTDTEVGHECQSRVSTSCAAKSRGSRRALPQY